MSAECCVTCIRLTRMRVELPQVRIVWRCVNNPHCFFSVCTVLTRNPTSTQFPHISRSDLWVGTGGLPLKSCCGIVPPASERAGAGGQIIIPSFSTSHGVMWQEEQVTRSLRKIVGTLGCSFTTISLGPCTGLKSPKNHCSVKSYTWLQDFFLWIMYAVGSGKSSPTQVLLCQKFLSWI